MSRQPRPAAGFGEEICHVRNAKGWSQQDLAEHAGVSRPSVARVETGQQGISTDTLQKIAKALDLQIVLATKDH